MGIRSLIILGSVAFAFAHPAPSVPGDDGAASKPQLSPQRISDLRIHYAGDVGTPHAKSFEAFLSQQFGRW